MIYRYFTSSSSFLEYRYVLYVSMIFIILFYTCLCYLFYHSFFLPSFLSFFLFFFLSAPTQGRVMVADGSVGSGSKFTDFPVAGVESITFLARCEVTL